MSDETHAPPIALLGPQRELPTADEVLSRFAPEGTIVTVTAGWQEREGEALELDGACAARARDLGLYHRAERVWHDDPELQRAHREMQNRLRFLRRVFNIRLAHAMDALVDLTATEGDAEVIEAERTAALDSVRRLDWWHLSRIAKFRAEFEAALEPERRPAVTREREAVAAELHDAAAVAIAGGHVAILVNRLRLFGVRDLIANKPIVAWSAGAMALSERIVLFHDSPPQGPGHAEVLDNGLGLARNVVPLPHSGDRLRLDDPVRVGRLARRFGPALCVALDPGEGIERRNGSWTPLYGEDPSPLKGARRLEGDGHVTELTA